MSGSIESESLSFPIRVLHIINNLSAGGAEKLILDTLPLYKEKGIDVHLLLLNNRVPAFYEELRKTACCPIYILGNKSVYNPLLVFKIVPFLKKFDVVHVHLFPALYWVAMAKLLGFSHTRLCFTEHGTTNRRRLNPLFKIIDRFIYKRYNTVISISADVDKSLRNYLGIDTDKIKLIPNGIDLRKIREAEPYPRSVFFKEENVKIVIMVSRFYEPKDQLTIIKSLLHLPENVKLLLVGDGDLLQQCKKLAKEIRLLNRIVFTGVRLDVPSILKTADIVVVSTKHEGFSLASLEGMASGRPVVASDVPAISELIKGTGVLFPVGNPEALANEILHLLSDDEHYRKVADACMVKASEYSIEKMVDQYIALWQEITGDSS
ncbi:MAG TPA: glycosyltransferase [Bacteroidales bacterium]|nr:glycosyltransferase [Bacteroidales bacterium]